MLGAAPKELPLRIGLILIPNFSMIAFTAAVEPLRLANRASGRSLYEWHLFSVDGRPVTASNGISLTPEGDLEKAAAMPVVIVCSGVDVQKNTDKAVISWLRRVARKGAETRGPVHRQPYPGPRRFARRLPLHHPLGKSGRLRRGFSRRSRSPPNCSRSTATALPVPAAPRRST